MSSAKNINDFDPNTAGNKNLNIFGLPFSTEDAKIVLLPVTWDVTVSFNEGTCNGPKSIFDASYQVDLYDSFFGNFWKAGIAMTKPSNILAKGNKTLRKEAEKIIEFASQGKSIANSTEQKKRLKIINNECRLLALTVKKESLKYLNKNKFVGVIGGEHSVSLGLMQALSEKYSDFGVLQIDAHADLRNSFEGFEYSHASAMYNALKIPAIKKLVQVGIRDYCEEEADLIRKSKKRISTFYDQDLKNKLYQGITWDKICDEIIKSLPDNVYISFDIDGLDPKLCPNTGTPVPGGLEFEQVNYLFEKLCKSGKKIIGFDLCEVSPGKDEWDANVGARLLYKLSGLTAKSNKW
jgi:agmatinase